MQLHMRGLSCCELARAAGVSAPTVSAAAAGRSISVRSARLIALALLNAEPIPGMHELVTDRDDAPC
jgi:transcriptional regulator with XRE-family HTH domain